MTSHFDGNISTCPLITSWVVRLHAFPLFSCSIFCRELFCFLNKRNDHLVRLCACDAQIMSNFCFVQASYVLPSNFEEVATGVLKVLNNLALLDLKFLQTMLVSYLISHWILEFCLYGIFQI